MDKVKITFIPNGPAKIDGSVTFVHPDGTEETKESSYICRCGKSKKFPWCDGSHRG